MEASSFDTPDPGALLKTIEALLNINKRHHFFLWAQSELQAIFPHEAMVCCLYGQDGACAGVQQFAWKPYFSEKALSQSLQPGGAFAQLTESWAVAQKPSFFKLESLRGQFVEEALFAEQLGGFSSAAVHGIRGHEGRPVSVFMFFGMPDTLVERRACVLELVVPHMHGALTRVLPDGEGQAVAVPSGLLSGREREVLSLISAGKTNAEISQVLFLSPFTVKNHVKNIFRKLNTTSRSQAVALALARGLIGTSQ